MGQEITQGRFSTEDFLCFGERLERETRLLESWLLEGCFERGHHLGGVELEAWLVDGEAAPAPLNQASIERIGDSLVVPELARFNLELNSQPRALCGGVLSHLADELAATWNKCDLLARDQGARMAMIGILPTVTQADLCLDNMSPLRRYHALDEQLFKLRGGEAVELDIVGRERLRLHHLDVMLEAATNSLQIHLRINPDQAVRYYNASKILAAPLVALSANSPYLFGRDLWDETRVPLFEQAVAVGGDALTRRVTFGVRYLRRSVMELFQANLDRYPVLLPRLLGQADDRLAHLCLHNGTIWRWNRPLVGFSDQGVPHLRIEHRVLPAGPSLEDCVANAALYFGLVFSLANAPEPPETQLSHAAAGNFYRAARHGLAARVVWLDGRSGALMRLCTQRLLPMAMAGLVSMGIDPAEAAHWLGIVRERLRRRQTGALWQRRWVARHGRDMRGLTLAYLERQERGGPIHQWEV
ncbi:MAG: glutamate--cysteine ligase [gamma proteobacterium symbiont of Phacoides pectinatus]